MSKEELLKYLIAEIDLIMHDKDYRFENANGTWYSRESCRDLTNEEVFEELRTELRQFADLEAKLADSEEEHELLIDQFEEETEKLRKQIKQESDARKRLVEEVKNLRQQLAESENKCRECKHLNKKIELNIKNKLMAENCELQKQLAEKEEEYQSFKKIADENVNYLKNRILEETKNYNQDKISFAVEQLEKAKSFCISAEDNGWCVTHKNWLEIVEYIDNQIKAIKGEK